MKLTPTIISLVVLSSFASLTSATKAVHNSKYDKGESLINTITCHSDLQARYPSLGKLPTYPNVGGYQNAACGSCWAIEYASEPPIYFISVDSNNDGLQLSIQTMDTLTGSGSQYLFVPVQVTAADKSNCGL